jgi:hypothetical protein
MAVKITLTLDESTVTLPNQTATRLAKPKSAVVCEAIRDYHAKSDRLTEMEYRRMLHVLEEYAKTPLTGTQADVDRELREIRASRRRGWSRPSDFK